VIEWLDLIYPIFSRLDEACFYHSSIAAMSELIKHGCTTAFDHQYNFPRHAGKQLIDRQFEAASLLGMRFHAGRGSNTLPKSEGSTIPDEMCETTDEFIHDCARLIDTYHDSARFSMRQVAIAPCQPVNCYKETFTESIALARDKKVLLHSHVGEGESDVIRCLAGSLLGAKPSGNTPTCPIANRGIALPRTGVFSRRRSYPHRRDASGWGTYRSWC